MYYMRVCVHLVLVQIELATALAVLLLACDGADAAGTSQRTHTGCSNLSRCVWGAFVAAEVHCTASNWLSCGGVKLP